MSEVGEAVLSEPRGSEGIALPQQVVPLPNIQKPSNSSSPSKPIVIETISTAGKMPPLGEDILHAESQYSFNADVNHSNQTLAVMGSNQMLEKGKMVGSSASIVSLQQHLRQVKKSHKRETGGMKRGRRSSVAVNVKKTNGKDKVSVSSNVHQENCHELRKFLSNVLISHYVEHPENIRSDKVGINKLRGAFMIADVSGFSKLSAKLEQAGPKGAERMCQFLNRYYTLMINIIVKYGGDILKYAGDALLVIFREATEEAKYIPSFYTQKTVCMASCQAAIEMTNQLTGYKLEDDVTLSLHIGIVYGDFLGLHFGQLDSERWEYIVVGKPLHNLGEIVDTALPGETAVSLEVAEILKEEGEFTISQIEKPDVNVQHSRILLNMKESCLKALEEANEQKRKCLDITDDEMIDAFEILESYVVVPVRIIVDLGLNTIWLNEIRRITTIFIGFPTILQGSEDVEAGDTDFIDQYQTAFSQLVSIVHSRRGSVLQCIVDDKGTLFIAAFGMPPLSHNEDIESAVQTCLDYKSIRLNTKVPFGKRDYTAGFSIGITTGIAFIGVVGSEEHCAYTLIGDSVNMSARLMKYPYASHNILCDSTTYEETKNLFVYRNMGSIKVKGKEERLDVYRPIERIIPDLNDMKGTFLEKSVLQLASVGLKAIDRSGNGGQAIYVGVQYGVGPGKSNILNLLKQALMREMRDVDTPSFTLDVFVTGCTFTDSHAPLFALRHLLMHLLDVNDSDSLKAKEQKILDFFASEISDVMPKLFLLNEILFVDFASQEEVSAPGGDMKDSMVSNEGGINYEGLTDLLVKMIDIRKGEGALCYLVHDSHWMDEDSLRIIVSALPRLKRYIVYSCSYYFEFLQNIDPDITKGGRDTTPLFRKVDLNKMEQDYDRGHDILMPSLSEESAPKKSSKRASLLNPIAGFQKIKNYIAVKNVFNKLGINVDYMMKKSSAVSQAPSSLELTTIENEIHAFDSFPTRAQMIVKTASCMSSLFNTDMIEYALGKTGDNMGNIMKEDIPELMKELCKHRLFVHARPVDLVKAEVDGVYSILREIGAVKDDEIWFKFVRKNTKFAVYELLNDEIRCSLHTGLSKYVEGFLKGQAPSVATQVFFGSNSKLAGLYGESFQYLVSALKRMHGYSSGEGSAGKILCNSGLETKFGYEHPLALKCVELTQEVLPQLLKTKELPSNEDLMIFSFLSTRTQFILRNYDCFEKAAEKAFQIHGLKTLTHGPDMVVINILKGFRARSELKSFIRSLTKRRYDNELSCVEQRKAILCHDYVVNSLLIGRITFKVGKALRDGINSLNGNGMNVVAFTSMLAVLSSLLPLFNHFKLVRELLSFTISSAQNMEAESDQHSIKFIYYFLGITYLQKGRYNLALSFMKQSGEIVSCTQYLLLSSLAKVCEGYYGQATTDLARFHNPGSDWVSVHSNDDPLFVEAISAFIDIETSSFEGQLQTASAVATSHQTLLGNGIKGTKSYMLTYLGITSALCVIYARENNIDAAAELIPECLTLIPRCENLNTRRQYGKRNYYHMVLHRTFFTVAGIYVVEVLLRIWVEENNKGSKRAKKYRKLFLKFYERMLEACTKIAHPPYHVARLKKLKACQLFMDKNFALSAALFNEVLEICHENNLFSTFDSTWYHAHFLFSSKHSKQPFDLDSSEHSAYTKPFREFQTVRSGGETYSESPIRNIDAAEKGKLWVRNALGHLALRQAYCFSFSSNIAQLVKKAYTQDAQKADMFSFEELLSRFGTESPIASGQSQG
eukprot:Nk52_evm5s1569 gene=Nk52_evmTU5s1569